MTQIIVPELGDGIEKATIACWHFAEGDMVQEGDDVLELVTDKASFNISATQSGKLKRIAASEGEEVPIGSAVGVIE